MRVGRLPPPPRTSSQEIWKIIRSNRNNGGGRVEPRRPFWDESWLISLWLMDPTYVLHLCVCQFALASLFICKNAVSRIESTLPLHRELSLSLSLLYNKYVYTPRTLVVSWRRGNMISHVAFFIKNLMALFFKWLVVHIVWQKKRTNI